MIVKICGITSVADAQFALSAGADWIGINLVGGPRRVEMSVCADILAGLDELSRAVVLVRGKGGSLPQDCLAFLRQGGVRRLQLYGDRSHLLIDRLHDEGWETIQVHHVGDHSSLIELDGCLRSNRAWRPDYVLLDTAVSGLEGGTGKTADWNAVAEFQNTARGSTFPPLILAGGLTPQNVARAIQQTSPHGVDVSSGVESSPGRKDHKKVAAFISAVRNL